MLQFLDAPPEGLFWSAPLDSQSDFTAEDPLALDYLGQQVGLWLFQGFTTRTSRAQYYAVVLYGLYLAERAIRHYGYLGDDETRTRLFERWERFWALATLECRNGQLSRGDEDAMRGVRGATRAWSSGTGSLTLDFPLISRQNELGGLGAYLVSLRDYGLVFPGSLRTTPAATAIIDAFWVEQGQRETAHLYEEYALDALDFDKAKIARQKGKLSLAGIGKASRLSTLVQRSRNKQQQRLWEALFVSARDDSTFLLAERLIAASNEGIDDPEVILEELLAGKWGPLNASVTGKTEAALAFGRLARILLTRFDRAYGFVDQHGWVADCDAVAYASFPESEIGELRTASNEVLRTTESGRFRQLQYHGPELMALATKLAQAEPHECFRYLLGFHRGVQRTRRGGGAWIREEQGKVVMQVYGYNGYKTDAAFPSFKLGVVRQLLADLGRLG